MCQSVFKLENYASYETLSRLTDRKNMEELLLKAAGEYPDSIAVTDRGEYSYKELYSMVAAYRTVLKDAGLKSGDRVGILSPNSIDFIKVYFAVTTAGMTAVLLPAQLPDKTVYGLSKKFMLQAVICAEVCRSGCGLLSDIPVLSAEESGRNETAAFDCGTDVPCAVLLTSGTTGQSKGAVLSHRALLRGAKNGCYGLSEIFSQRYLLVLPLTHVFGLVRNLLTSIYTGSNLFICRDNKDMFRDMAVFRPTVLVLVPALVEMALDLSRQFGRDMLGGEVKYIICGAAQVSANLITEYKKRGISIFPGYGLTESANLVSGNPDSAENPKSVGFVYPDMETKIVNGELWLKGPNMMDGYLNDPQANAEAYEDGWFKTGDLAYIDEKGYLYITGRTKEILVLPSGENVSPAEVEAWFYLLDDVRDCAVYIKNGRLTAEILPRLSCLGNIPAEKRMEHFKKLTDRVNMQLPAYARITEVVLRDRDFERTPSMKIVRPKGDE